jgi:hypothetical protein
MNIEITPQIGHEISVLHRVRFIIFLFIKRTRFYEVRLATGKDTPTFLKRADESANGKTTIKRGGHYYRF